MPAVDRKISELNLEGTLAPTDKFLVSDTDAVTGGQAKFIQATNVKTNMLSDFFSFNSVSGKIIATGVVALSDRSDLRVEAEGGGGGADDLVTITGSTRGVFLTVWARSGSTITVKHGTGNIFLDGAADKTLDSLRDRLVLYNIDGTNLCQVSFSNNT